MYKFINLVYMNDTNKSKVKMEKKMGYRNDEIVLEKDRFI